MPDARTVVLRLPYRRPSAAVGRRRPLAADELFGFLAARAVPDPGPPERGRPCPATDAGGPGAGVGGAGAGPGRGRRLLDPGSDPDEAAARLVALSGVGPRTAGYIRLRGLGEPDVFLPSDLGVRRALDRLGAVGVDPARWRPWRSYALHHLWSSLSGR